MSEIGVEHKPHAPDECRILLIEPAGTVNTGGAGDGRAANEAGIVTSTGDWI
jgi:hypothetical protein